MSRKEHFIACNVTETHSRSQRLRTPLSDLLAQSLAHTTATGFHFFPLLFLCIAVGVYEIFCSLTKWIANLFESIRASRSNVESTWEKIICLTPFPFVRLAFHETPQRYLIGVPTTVKTSFGSISFSSRDTQQARRLSLVKSLPQRRTKRTEKRTTKLLQVRLMNLPNCLIIYQW